MSTTRILMPRTQIAASFLVFALFLPSVASAAPPRSPASVGAHSVSYAVPKSAATRFVSVTGDDNNDGSSARPFKTIQHAIYETAPGGTVVVSGGTYAEDGIQLFKRVTVQPRLGDAVEITGATALTQWTPSGNGAVTDWPYKLPSVGTLVNNSGCDDSTPKCYLDPKHPEADRAEVVTLNGVSLTPVLSRAQVTASSFYVDDKNAKLYIGINPAGASVNASIKPYGVSITGDGGVVRGITFTHFYQRAVYVYASNATVDNVVVKQAGIAGVESCCQNARGNTIRNSSFYDIGFGAISVSATDGTLVQNNFISGSNARLFQTNWSAAGSKSIFLTNSTFRGNYFTKTHGDALWCDVSCDGVTIVDNSFVENEGSGVNFEISNNAVVARNLFLRNGGAGVIVESSSNALIWNNTFVDNGFVQIYVFVDGRAEITGTEIGNNLLVSDGTSSIGTLIYSGRGVDDAPAQEEYAAFDNNGYVRSGPTTTNIVGGDVASFFVGQQPSGQNYFTSLADLRQTTGFELNGIEILATRTQLFNNPAISDYRLRPRSPAIGKGSVLPDAVLKALNVTAGAPFNIGAY